MRHHVVMASGGVGSATAGLRVAQKYGTDNLTWLFTDTKCEHPDTYRFLRESCASVGGRLVEIAEGRTIWEVFRDKKFLGNSRVDPCSLILKRQMADRWLAQHHTTESVTVHIGIDWSERHRFENLAERKKPWVYEAPLCEPPYLTKDQMHDLWEQRGVAKQYLYRIGASHANCGGGCIEMGIGGFARLLRNDPTTYAEWERNEQVMRDQLGDVAILRDRTGGEAKPLTLAALRERLASGGTCDLFDVGGCGCFVDSDQEERAE